MLQNTNLLIQGSVLPPTFRGTPQDLFVAMLERMRIVSPAGTAFFIISDTEPSSNLGPWLKGQAWFVWDETLKRYVPLDVSQSETKWFQTSVTTPATSEPPVWLQIAADGNPVSWRWWNGSVWVDFTTLKDRSVTQAKLYWLANFYAVAQGTNDYTASFSPSEGFGYGDGVNGSFLVLVKFPNTNTGPVTLNVNNLSPRPVKKQTNQPIVAGEIMAGSVHLLAYDGENFQVLSPLAVLPATVHGIPNFFEPILIYSGNVIGFTVYNNAVGDGVPADASAVILQCQAACGFSSTDAIIQIQKLAGQPIYDALTIRQSTNGESQNITTQGIFPIATQTFSGVGFKYAVVGTLDGNATIKLIGYIS